MFRILRCFPLIVLLFVTVGCAQNYYNVPRESYEKKVRILGVAPLFVDGESDIRHPEKESLVALIKSQNRKNEQELVNLLKETGSYLSVRMPEAQSDELFSSLVFRRERRVDAGVTYNKYFFKQQELKALIEKNRLDALMVVVVSGLTAPEKIYSSNLLAFLESNYNTLIMTAQILDADGTILWEYPNFQKRMLSLPPLINLQYPDFDDAAANATDKVEVRFKTIPGITRAFDKTKSASGPIDAKVSRLYCDIFDDMISMLKPEFRFPWETKKEVRPAASQLEPSAPVYVPPAAESAPAQPVKIESTRPVQPDVMPEPVPQPPGEIKTEDLNPAAK